MTDRMTADQQLAPGAAIAASNGFYRLTYQGDGNLVLYKDFPGLEARPLWASDTAGTSPGSCVMQPDGNLVVYDGSGAPVWASGTDGNPGSCVVVQDDGNLVVYAADGATPLWASDTVTGLPPSGAPPSGSGLRPGEALGVHASTTSPSGRFTLVYQDDGNLVLYRDRGTQNECYQWDTETWGRPAGRTIMQVDGNLVVYDPDGQPQWSTGTDGHPGSTLAVQDDGNVVVYAADGTTPLWHSDTPRITRRAGVPGLDGWVELTVRPSGLIRFSGHLHNDAVTGYRYRLRTVLRSGPTSVALSRSGYVGGDVSTASADEDWAEEYVNPQVALHYGAFERQPPVVEVFENHTGVVTELLEDVLDLVVDLTVGVVVGSTVGLVILVGVELASLIDTGSLTAGSTILGGNLLLLGPANTVFVLAAAGLAALATERRHPTEQEYELADRVFAGTLPPRGDLILTDAVGIGGRPFTFPRFDGKITVNLGGAAYADPLADSGLFVHELTHAWQIQHHPLGVEWVADALVTQLKNSVTGGGYDPGDPGPAWDEFNLEQQATIVERWFRGGMSATDRWYGYIEGNLRVGKA